MNPLEAPRVAEPADLPSIQRLNAAAYAVYLARMDRPPAPVTHDYAAEIQAGQVWLIGGRTSPGRLTGPGDRTGPGGLGDRTGPGGASDQSPIGLIVLIPAGDSLLIENIAVAPESQGQGAGRLLMEFAERRAAALGLRRLTLYTNEVMVENIAIYARLGYVETERRFENGYNRVFMEKRLPTSPASA